MNTDVTKEKNLSHRITVIARESMEIHGVNDVVSFDEQTVILNTACGEMTVEGSALHVRILNVEQGTVALDGQINGITYFDCNNDSPREKGSFFGKLFH